MEGTIRYYQGTRFVDKELLPVTPWGAPIVPRKDETVIFQGFEYKVVDVFWRFKAMSVTVYASLDGSRFEYGSNVDAGRVEKDPRS